MKGELTWGATQKGQKLIIFNGNEFTKKLSTKTTTHWRCSKWRSHSCKATLITCADRLLSSKNDHSHDIVPGKPEARQIVERMKYTARNEQDPVNSAVIATQVATVDEISVQLSMPSRSALNRTLNRQKQKNNETSKIAITCSERNFALPDEYKDFCLFDSGMDDKERILIFGDATMLEKKPTFSIEIWNQNQESSDGLVRTTNAVEGWHLGVTALFHGSHPPITTFLSQNQIGQFQPEVQFLEGSYGHSE